jgi:putative endonuclease
LSQQDNYLYGVQSEQLAVEYFETIGFEVLARRYKTKLGEIDLVIKKDTQLIFIEVKARKRKTSTEEILTTRQISRIYSAAEIFLSEFPEYNEFECRFDLLIIFKNKILDHIKNISNTD